MKPGDMVRVKGQKGLHKVVEIGNALTRVQNERGDEFWTPRERITPAPEPKPKTRALSPFLLHLRASCFISGCGPIAQLPLFEQRYLKATGHILNGRSCHIAWSEKESWSYSLCVRFPAPSDSVHVPDNAKPCGAHQFEIWSNELVFELFEQGFDLGRNGAVDTAYELNTRIQQQYAEEMMRTAHTLGATGAVHDELFAEA